MYIFSLYQRADIASNCALQGQLVNPFTSGGLFYHYSLDGSISNIRVPCFIEILEFNTNSVDPDQVPHNAASDQVLYCLLPFCGVQD